MTSLRGSVRIALSLACWTALAAGCGASAWTVWAAAGGNLWSCAFADEVVAPVYESVWVGNRTFALGDEVTVRDVARRLAMVFSL